MNGGFNRRSGVTKLKQKTAEWFNKRKKTVDVDFERQNEDLRHKMNETRSLYRDIVSIFECNEATMMHNE